MAKKLPQTVSVIERRLQSGSVQRMGSDPVTLREKGWTVRFINSIVRPDRQYQAIHKQGWVFVEPTELADDPSSLGLTIAENRVVRGDRGQEVLVKMRLADYKRLQAQKTRENNAGIGSSKKTKEQLAEAAASRFGDQAGEFVAKQVVGEVIDSKERVMEEF